MNQPLQSIIQHLFQVNSLDDVSRQRLETFVEEYPSFGIGHYLLSHKLRTEDPDRCREVTQRTGLYFSNPLWLQWLLENTVKGSITEEAIQHPVPDAPEAIIEEPVGAVSDTTLKEPVGAVSEAIIEEPAGAASETTIEEPAGETSVESIDEAISETPEVTGEAPADSETVSAADQLLLSIEQAKGLRDSLQKINEDFRVEPVQQDEPIQQAESIQQVEPIQQVEHVHLAEPIHQAEPIQRDEPIQDEETPFVLDEPVETPETQTQAQPQPNTPSPTPETPPAPTPDLVFEPYHTIDYFASQGIKLKLEENPGDALGKQLKSFTDWLKVMRRLPQKERESTVHDRIAEQEVQSFAAHSIQSKDIVTETMAEVLIKQGMRDRARAIYEKLSLLNPDKKAYFAAKIEQLNIP